MKVAQEAKHQAALDTEKRLKAVDAKIGKKVAEAEAKIRAAADAARRELGPVAAEAASELVSKLTGQKISAKDAETTVKAVLHG
jgi:F-type H+-transporting ATPase subunit b